MHSRTLPDGHDALQLGRANLAATIACQLARAETAGGGGEREREG